MKKPKQKTAPSEGRIRFTNSGRSRKAGGDALAASSATRTALIDVTEKILMEEGFAALSSRRIGKDAGVKPTIIYYYFRTIEDLYLAVLQRFTERDLERLRGALQSERPLSALWQVNRERYTKVGAEFRALANHCDVIRSAFAAHAEVIRTLQTQALARYFEARGIEPSMPYSAMLFLLTGAANVLSVEARLGVSSGHAETVQYIEAWLHALETTGAGLGSVEIDRSSGAPSRGRQ